ncbi:Hsp70 family protein [Desulforhabdus amnigena]|uniref:Heat-shock protein n=1 Tax=Desulforhabdus amnigena TaxID=40218 RepID=A0A9W6FT82_9BACT|nr:Hsp70 family protein [Desulforhabdus amnigena]NLJ29514.1 hsp70 family protein [Deltaproteobacteria bacterium]GLI32586.1 heat-shock protein [Desulforhabdus amnigena]
MDNPFEFEDITYRYIVGIDLGTTNSALAYVDLSRKDKQPREIQFLEFPQLTAPGEVSRRPVLPSFLYLPGPYELPPESTALPWDSKRNFAVGEFAREQGALVPGRMVSSAKSWLCHGGVDRTGAILPWGAGSDVQKVSPVDASARYLQHMRESWNEIIGRGREGFRLEEQLVILTVPASFDEVARELTVTAARNAGLPRIVLLEEPLAAFYAWLARHEDDWQTQMQPGQMILVCDVGGGTTDFTIIAIREGEKGLRFDRLAVGDHLMLGGDNMDLSLARHLEVQLVGEPGKLDTKRWHQLWHQCRKAKEVLLGEAEPTLSSSPESAAREAAPDTFTISLMGTGRKLIADTLKGTLTKAQVEALILEGFFPFVSPDEVPRGGRRSGLTEWGLPFVQDAAVTRHLAAFWKRYRSLLQQETGRDALYPDFVLFNGGALTPVSIRRRILEVVKHWFEAEAKEGWIPIELENTRPELAVAIGAAYYGLVRQGEGVRIGAGSPRSYYVEVNTVSREGESGGTHPAVCLVPRGTEEGFEAQLNRPAFEVLANQPVAFQIFSSSTRLGDHLGDVLTLSPDEITPLPPIRTVLRYGKKSTAQALPVLLAIRLTEVGTLELWCQSQKSPHRWQLQFDVRQAAEPEAPLAVSTGETLDTEIIERAQAAIKGVFRKGETSSDNSPEKLVKNLVTLLELGKENWPTPLIRKLADTLLECKKENALTPQHEARWFNLLGYCLRPGFGDPLDEWRMKEIWKIYPQGLQYARQAQNRTEWWIFWRRVAGGLTAGHQWYIFQQVWPILQPVDKKKKKGAKRPLKSLSLQEELEIWMALANFERLPVKNKMELGRIALERIRKGKFKSQELWTLGRLGARIPFYGPLDLVVPSGEASLWLNTLLSLDLEPTEALAQALLQLGRRTGDRERDLPQEDRDRLAQWLDPLPQSERYREVLSNPDIALMTGEKDWIFGEALPSGLILSSPGSVSTD